jgi:hypothetical protein
MIGTDCNRRGVTDGYDEAGRPGRQSLWAARSPVKICVVMMTQLSAPRNRNCSEKSTERNK